MVTLLKKFDKKLHDVQYKTCDHSWVINAGLISERIKKLCKAVRKEMRSEGDGGGVVSWNIDCRGIADEPPRPREKLCRRDENLIDAELGKDASTDGDGGRAGLMGAGATPLRNGEEFAEFTLLAFFLDPNERRKDHSDSN
jgi:hypothetical protein